MDNHNPKNQNALLWVILFVFFFSLTLPSLYRLYGAVIALAALAAYSFYVSFVEGGKLYFSLGCLALGAGAYSLFYRLL